MGRGSHIQALTFYIQLTDPCASWRESEGWEGITPQDFTPTSCSPYTPSPGEPGHFHRFRYRLYMDDIQMCVPCQGVFPGLPAGVGECRWDISTWMFHGLLKIHISKLKGSSLFELTALLLHPLSQQKAPPSTGCLSQSPKACGFHLLNVLCTWRP